ncbi:phosphodiester glycosidase family protein [Armatimonas sp.]|uniref:phosphodiester glycosidase family protein n=1 Tax=Armatimonas sp. TaxID=1872638 RepID=UPI00286A18BF|nr:phosphodiester glycosidase family protein [Armatimonas sp.]
MFMPFVAIIALFCVSAPTAKKKETVRQLAPGVELVQEVTPEGDKDGPLVVTTVRIDPKVKGVRVEAALGGDTVWANDATLGREIPSKTVARRKAVAGINASFFPFAGNPIGLHIENGELVTEPGLPRTAFVLLDDGTAQCARFSYAGAVNGKPLAGLNRKPGKGDELLLFTPIFAENTLKTEGRVEVVLEGVPLPLKPGAEQTGTVASVGEGGLTPIKPGSVVLSGGGALGTWLKEWARPGEKANLNLTITPLDGSPALDPAKIRQAVTGSGWLLKNGKLALDLKAEKIAENFSTTRHPRTAVGVTGEGKILFVTVDGRQPKLSRGASLTELAVIMLAMGAVEAVNLDGGGSSACAVRGAVASSPSEGVERPVADSLLVFADEPMVMPVLATLAPTTPLGVGEVRQLALPDGVDAATAAWTVRGGVGFIDQEGVFRAQRPGKGTVLLWRGTESLELPIVVTKSTIVPTKPEPKLDSAAFIPQGIFSTNGGTLMLTISNSEGDKLGNEIILLQVTGGVATPNPVTTSPKGEATVTIQWDSATAPAARKIKLSSPNKRFESVTIKPT